VPDSSAPDRDGPDSSAPDRNEPRDDTTGGSAPVPPADPRQAALQQTVRELERHVASGGWDGPVRLFALIRTAGAIDRDPALAERLPADVVREARLDTEHLTAVEQEGLPEAENLEHLLGQIRWPDTVDGAAVVVERIVVPPEAEAGLPDNPDAAQAALLADHRRRDLRLVAGVLRNGVQACAIRSRDHDSDDRVAVGPDLVPNLVTALATTLDPSGA
jgi:hypothetical protein